MSVKRARHNRRQRLPPEIHPPGPFAEQMAAASERDRVWFEQHPDRDRYVRPRMEREFGMLENDPNFLHKANYVLGTVLQATLQSR